MIPNTLHYVYIKKRPWKLHHDSHIKTLFEENHDFPQAYSHHLWESSGKDYLGKLTEEK